METTGNGNGNGNGNGHSNGNSAKPVKSISSTLKEFTAIGFRHRQLIRTAFLWSLLAALLAIYIVGLKFESDFEILVKHDRVAPAVTPDDNPRPQLPTDASATTIDITNESEILQSNDLLDSVVDACPMTMWGEPKWYTPYWRKVTALVPGYDDERKPQAVAKLATDLQVSVVSSTGLMTVAYANGDPVQSSCVTNNLVRLYLQKHLVVNRMPKVYDFFAAQTEDARKKLADSEAKLVEFAKSQDAVQAGAQMNNAVQKASDFEATLKNDIKMVHATEEQLAQLKALQKVVPERVRTQSRDSDNSLLLGSLTGTLNTLELQRVNLSTNYEDSYRLMQEIDEQIQVTKSQIARQEKDPLGDTTYDVNPVWNWVNQTIAQATTALANEKAQVDADLSIVSQYHSEAQNLNAKSVTQDDLQREVSANQANYLLYLGKREQARIQDMLDERKVLNVSVAEPPTNPDQTLYSPLLLISLALFFAAFISAGAALIADYLDPSFRTPDEVREFLDVPVFASIPENGYEVPVSSEKNNY
jgi:uncharacterized protein involved in exopolysaccharide biosynthesis